MSKAAKSVRPAVVAGRFFPADPAALRQAAEACITKGQAGWQPQGLCPRAVIAPHAGLSFSGWLTGAAWRATARRRQKRVVILSPSHRHAFDGLALPQARAYGMPGFEVPIDELAKQTLINAKLAHIEDDAHDREHGIETQLAFMHRLHPGAQVVPLVIGRAGVADVARAVDALAGMEEEPPLFVLSSDLSHFLPLDKAQAHDDEAARLIETGKIEALSPAHACGSRAVAGYLASDHAQGNRALRLAMASSHAVTGDADRTVGYGAWAFFGAEDEILQPAMRQMLLRVARQALASRLAKGRAPEVNAASFPMPLQTHAAAFVTVQKEGRLRGCIGSLVAHRPLVADVVENAVKAGFADPRFKPLQTGELDQVALKIAVLSPSRPMAFSDQADLERQLVPGRDGLILSDGRHRGTFLPMVWDNLNTPHEFVQGLKVKAGLPKDHWSDSLQIRRFHAESFAE